MERESATTDFDYCALTAPLSNEKRKKRGELMRMEIS